jgi:hypothetical protein
MPKIYGFSWKQKEVKLLHSYLNGNSHVCLYEDGTKERTYNGIPDATHPESIDVKITNYCDAGCSYCHEKSTIAGSHGDLDVLTETLSCLPAGVEIAIGGGNPLSHPQLVPFLTAMKAQGLICNITINQKHLKEYKDLILSLIYQELVYGVGISYSSKVYLENIKPFLEASSNVVFHVIMGINGVSDIDDLMNVCQTHARVCKILILGYKSYGFGLNYYLKNKRIEDVKYQWYTKLATYFKKPDLVLSFDNLAISQMNLKRFFTGAAWDKFFMGTDGQFTCYIDAVEQQYAMSSTSSDRVSFKEKDLLSFFVSLK